MARGPFVRCQHRSTGGDATQSGVAGESPRRIRSQFSRHCARGRASASERQFGLVALAQQNPSARSRSRRSRGGGGKPPSQERQRTIELGRLRLGLERRVDQLSVDAPRLQRSSDPLVIPNPRARGLSSRTGGRSARRPGSPARPSASIARIDLAGGRALSASRWLRISAAVRSRRSRYDRRTRAPARAARRSPASPRRYVAMSVLMAALPAVSVASTACSGASLRVSIGLTRSRLIPSAA